MEQSKLSLYKYSIDEILIIFSNGSKDKIAPLNVGSINIEKDFDQNFCPIFNIVASVSIDLYKKVASDRNVKAKIKINKIAVKAGSEFVDDTPKYEQPFIDGVFNIRMDGTDLDPKSEIQKDAEKHLENNSENNFNTELNIFLFTEQALESRRSIDSMIYADTDPMSTIVHLAYECGIRRMLISKPDNTNRETQIVVPETKLVPMIRNIENIYGVYDTGSVLFYDFDKFYYISKDINNNFAREVGELSLVNMNFEEYATDLDRNAGSYIDKKNDRYYINATSYPEFQNIGNFTQEVTFNDINYVNTMTGETSHKKIDFGANGTNKVIVDDTYNNPHIIKSKIYDLSENYFIVSLVLKEVDISAFTPNKRYYMNFNLKEFDKSRKYTGTYRLAKVVHVLSKNGSDKWFESKSICIFKGPK